MNYNHLQFYSIGMTLFLWKFFSHGFEFTNTLNLIFLIFIDFNAKDVMSSTNLRGFFHIPELVPNSHDKTDLWKFFTFK